MTHALAFAKKGVTRLDLPETPDRLLTIATGLIVDVGDGAARPGTTADHTLLVQCAMPLFHAPPQRRKRTAFERKALIGKLGGIDVVDQIVHLRDGRGIAGKEARDVPPARGRHRKL